MNQHRLSESVSTLYSELLDQSILAAAEEATQSAPSGTFTSKNIKGRIYWYLQKSEGESKRQIYVGADPPALNSRCSRYAKHETEQSRRKPAAAPVCHARGGRCDRRTSRRDQSSAASL